MTALDTPQFTSNKFSTTEFGVTEFGVTEPGWYRDPHEVHELRYFDGSEWTTNVTHLGPAPCDRCHQPAETPGR